MSRDASLAAFLLTCIAFLPTIRENLPVIPKLVITQMLVYVNNLFPHLFRLQLISQSGG